jgi:hypothetical protein
MYAMIESEGDDSLSLSAFCRTPCAESEEEYAKRNKILVGKGNGDAYYQLAG